MNPSSEIWTTYAEVGGILDYAAEAKDGELPETVKPIDEEDGDFLCLPCCCWLRNPAITS